MRPATVLVTNSAGVPHRWFDSGTYP